jgi:hypothetical protein
MFFPSSRYLSRPTYSVTRRDGTVVIATRLPSPGPAVVLGYYRRNDGDRLDHIAARFLADATRFWHVCDANGAVSPDALAVQDLVGVPIDAVKGG